MVHEDTETPVLHQPYGKYIIITTSAWRNANNSAAGCVGILINKKAEYALAEVKSWNGRTLVGHFMGREFPALTIIIHYSPVEGSISADEHYGNLLSAINDTPKHNVLLVVGDFNVHLEEDMSRFTYHKHTNRNGKIFNDLVNEAGLVVNNTQFQKKQGKFWTFISDMSGAKTQVDFIMINKKWRTTRTAKHIARSAVLAQTTRKQAKLPQEKYLTGMCYASKILEINIP